MRFDRVTQRRFRIDRIDIPPSLAFAREHTGFFEIGQYLSNGTLGDADFLGQIANT